MCAIGYYLFAQTNPYVRFYQWLAFKKLGLHSIICAIVLQHCGTIVHQPFHHSDYCKVSLIVTILLICCKGYISSILHSHPDVMLEAYESNGWNALFFIIFLVITVYLLTSVVRTYLHHVEE